MKWSEVIGRVSIFLYINSIPTFTSTWPCSSYYIRYEMNLSPSLSFPFLPFPLVSLIPIALFPILWNEIMLFAHHNNLLNCCLLWCLWFIGINLIILIIWILYIILYSVNNMRRDEQRDWERLYWRQRKGIESNDWKNESMKEIKINENIARIILMLL